MAKTTALASAPVEAADSFPAMFAALEGGAFSRDVTDSLRGIVRSLRETQAVNGGRPAARITILLDMQLIDGVIEVSGAFRVTAPERPRPRTPFLPTSANGLTDRADEQIELPLKGNPR